MSLTHLNPFHEKILVFIASSLPTDAERALADEHGTESFRCASNPKACYPIECHHYAVAVDPKLIPEGYKPYSETPEVPVTPVANPTQPTPRKAARKGAPVISGGDI